MTPLGTLDLRVGKREDNNTISQYVVNPVHLNSDNSVLKVILQIIPYQPCLHYPYNKVTRCLCVCTKGSR